MIMFCFVFRLSLITGYHFNEDEGEREWKVVGVFVRYLPLFSLLRRTRRGTGIGSNGKISPSTKKATL